MSVHAVAWVWRTKIGDALAKAVLLKIADNANDQGVAWPSVSSISAQTEIPERTVKKKIAYLIEAGLLEAEAKREGGRFVGNEYRLSPGAHGAHGSDSRTGGTPGANARASARTVSNGTSYRADRGHRVPTARDELWDALSEATGIVPATHGEKSRFGKSIKQLKEAGATPDEIKRRWLRLLARGWDAPTEMALVMHWGELAGKNGKPPPPPCDDCGVGGGLHLADCPRSRQATADRGGDKVAQS